MFYIISKILKVFLFPWTWIIGLLLIAIFLQDRKHRNKVLIIALGIFIIFTNQPCLQLCQYWTTKSYCSQTDPDRYYPVVVVMGGFGQMNTSTGQLNPYNDQGGRLYEPLRLQKMGIVGRILISGDQTIAIDKSGNSTEKIFRNYLHGFGTPDSCIISEPYARNTQENAAYSIAILDSLGYTPRDCLLVTSATHMKRAHDCFAALNWPLDTYAVNIYPKPIHLQLKNFLPSYEVATDWQELLNEWFGNIIYNIVGYK